MVPLKTYKYENIILLSNSNTVNFYEKLRPVKKNPIISKSMVTKVKQKSKITTSKEKWI